MAAKVAIVMGSKSDQDHLEATTRLLDEFEVSWEMNAISAHRRPDQLREYIHQAEAAGVQVFIAAAGLSAARPGVIGSHSNKPVIGLPVPGGTLKGIDALLSMVQMPGGIPVATVGVGSNGSKNAAILAVQILSLADDALAQKLTAFRDAMKND